MNDRYSDLFNVPAAAQPKSNRDNAHLIAKLPKTTWNPDIDRWIDPEARRLTEGLEVTDVLLEKLSYVLMSNNLNVLSVRNAGGTGPSLMLRIRASVAAAGHLRTTPNLTNGMLHLRGDEYRLTLRSH